MNWLSRYRGVIAFATILMSQFIGAAVAGTLPTPEELYARMRAGAETPFQTATGRFVRRSFQGPTKTPDQIRDEVENIINSVIADESKKGKDSFAQFRLQLPSIRD